MKHTGTKQEHSEESTTIDGRRTTNYCPKCNGWFKRREETK